MQVYSTTPAFDPEWFAEVGQYILAGADLATLWVTQDNRIILTVSNSRTAVQKDYGRKDWHKVVANPREAFLRISPWGAVRRQTLDLSTREAVLKSWVV